MVNAFNLEAVFEIAESIEKRGAEFYKNHANRVQDPLCKTLLLDLAQMESEHLITFAGMRAQFQNDKNFVHAVKEDDQRYWYLKALADTRVFFHVENEPTNMVEILKQAMQAEKESVIFYLGVKDLLKDDAGKSQVNKIIKEEMSHMILLGKQLIAVKDYVE